MSAIRLGAGGVYCQRNGRRIVLLERRDVESFASSGGTVTTFRTDDPDYPTVWGDTGLEYGHHPSGNDIVVSILDSCAEDPWIKARASIVGALPGILDRLKHPMLTAPLRLAIADLWRRADNPSDFIWESVRDARNDLAILSRRSEPYPS